jgi:hypothetical protein
VCVVGGLALFFEQWCLRQEGEEKREEDRPIVVGRLEAGEESSLRFTEVTVVSLVEDEVFDYSSEIVEVSSYMPSFLVVVLVAAFSLVCLETINVYECLAERGIEAEASDMSRVVAFDRRFVKTGSNTGLEVVLVKKLGGRGKWVGAIPSGSLREVDIGQRSVVKSVGDVGVAYTPFGAVSDRRKTELLAAVDAQILAGRSFAPITLAEKKTRFEIRWLAWSAAALPAVGAKWVRWALRSPSRSFGLLGMIYLVYLGMHHFGVFEGAYRYLLAGRDWYDEVRAKILEVSQVAKDFILIFEAIYESISNRMSVQTSVLGIVSTLLFLRCLREGAGVDESPAPSSVGSEIQTPAASTASTPIEKSGPDLSELIILQTEAIQKLAERMQSDREAAEVEALIATVSGRPDNNSSVLSEIRTKLNLFENILKEQKVDGREKVPAGPASPEMKTGLALKPRVEIEGEKSPGANSEGEQAAGKAESYEDDDVSEVIRGLVKQAEPPQETIVRALKEYQTLDPSVMVDAFPPGYRERIAPRFLAQVYSTGRTAKDWSKSWIKERKLDNCDDARRLIHIMSGLDVVFLVDKREGAINLVSTEQACKSAKAIVVGYDLCRHESDWRRPNSAKTWKSKVEAELMKRVDPGLLEEKPFVDRRADAEMRREMERDAALLKVKMKLEERADTNKRSE